LNYYSHHIGDYKRDTTHLSLLEHGTKEEPAPVWPEIPHQVTVQAWPKTKPAIGAHNPWGTNV